MAGEISHKSWADFEGSLKVYFERPSVRRSQFIFRGHAVADWRLEATIDRPPFKADAELRDRRIAFFRDQFSRECIGLVPRSELPENLRQLELFGRHHGLPTSILDWTLSPYIAAFFAYWKCKENDSVAVWAFDRQIFLDRDIQAESDAVRSEDPIEIWDSIDDYRYTTRAIEQQAVFMKVNLMEFQSDPIMTRALTKFVLPGSERKRVLARLRSMKIDPRSLFRSLDHAAATVQLAFELE